MNASLTATQPPPEHIDDRDARASLECIDDRDARAPPEHIDDRDAQLPLECFDDREVPDAAINRRRLSGGERRESATFCLYTVAILA
jgi:hypothetical protein